MIDRPLLLFADLFDFGQRYRSKGAIFVFSVFGPSGQNEICVFYLFVAAKTRPDQVGAEKRVIDRATVTMKELFGNVRGGGTI